MRTDKQLFQIFAACPEWLFELTGLPSPGACWMTTFTVKSLEREADGLVVPEDPAQPLTVVEFQFQRDERIYTRLVTEMAAAQEAHGMRPVQGLILFGTTGLDPLTEPWSRIVRRIVLQEVVPAFAREHSGHPLAAVFQPLVEENAQALETDAAHHYRVLQVADLDERQRDVLLDVFVDWLGQRFRNKHKQELEMILFEDLPDPADTVWGRELIEIGEKRGEKRAAHLAEQRGEKRGEKRGEELGLARAVRLLLKSRFQPVSKELAQRILRLTVSQKEQLLELAGKARSFDAIEKWMSRHSAKSRE